MTLPNHAIADTRAFGKLYEQYYSLLCTIAWEYTRDPVLAEEMVGETFLELWEKRESLEIHSSVKHYLIRSIQNTCLQYIRKKKLDTESLDSGFSDLHIPWGDDYPLGDLLEKELSEIIESAIQSLPEQCRNVFLLSRDEELTYPQIANRLNISENTVKSHMKTALSRLRVLLREYLSVLLTVI